jgi:hypothetical protein
MNMDKRSEHPRFAAAARLRAVLVRRFAATLQPFGSLWQNRDLRRLELAWAGSAVGAWAYQVALSLLAY